MTLSSAIDGEISNKEMQFIQTCINNLPIFKTYNSEDLEKTLSMFFELLSGDNDPETIIELIDQSLDKKNIIPNLVYMDLTNEFIIYEYIEGIELDIRKTDSEDRKKLSSLIESYQDIQIDLPKFNYFNHVSLYWQKIKEIKQIGNLRENKIEVFLAKLSNFQESNWPALLTHHDLETNILATDSGYKIIDWEYAGNGFHDFDRCSIGLIEKNEMIDDLIMVMNELWTEINYQN